MVSGRPVLPRLVALVELARLRTCLVSVLAYAIGLALNDVGWSVRAAVGVVISLLVPAVANVHNAVTDLAEDERNLPGRLRLVATAGPRLMMAFVNWTSLAMLLVTALISLPITVLAVLGSVLLRQYSARPLRAKARPFAGLALFSMVVTVPFLAGTMLTPQWSSLPHYHGHFVWVMAAYLTVWFCVKGMVKNVPDYHGDKAAGLRTSATIMPSLKSAGVAAAAATVTVYAAFPIIVLLGGLPGRLLPAGVWLLPAAANLSTFLRAQTAAALNRALAVDMLVSAGFLATILNLMKPGLASVALTLGCVALIVVVDVAGKDSRHARHARPDVPVTQQEGR